jgi:hypothetical protein
MAVAFASGSGSLVGTSYAEPSSKYLRVGFAATPFVASPPGSGVEPTAVAALFDAARARNTGVRISQEDQEGKPLRMPGAGENCP